MAKKKRSILPEEIADDFTVDPKAPVRFIHRRYGEFDLRKISRKAADFLASKKIYVSRVNKKDD